MKTYDIDFSGSRVEAIGPRGEFVKTADHFEAVAKFQDQLKAERAKSAALLLRFESALTQLSALVENARKGG